MRALEALGIMDADTEITKVRNVTLDRHFDKEEIFNSGKFFCVVFNHAELTNTDWEIGRDCKDCGATGYMCTIGGGGVPSEEYVCPNCDNGTVFSGEY